MCIVPAPIRSDRQHWLLCPVKSASTIWHAFHYTQSSFIIASSKRPNLVLDVDRSDGSILLYAEHGGDNQQFSFQSVRAASRTQPCSLPHAVIAACTAGDISQLGALLESESVHMACMRSELDALLGGAPNASDASSSSSSSSASGSTGYEWLSANRRALECFLSSGGCTKAHDGSEYARVPRVERWRNAIAILSAILARFPDVAAAASEDATYDSAALPQPPLPLLQRMAIATALAFSSGVPCHAGLAVGLIEPVGRFALFREWVELGILFPDFHDLSAWHLRFASMSPLDSLCFRTVRFDLQVFGQSTCVFVSKLPSYVLGSWATNDELAWAQEHCPDRFKTRNAVARATHHMVEYTAANEAGISIHDPDAFYGGQPPTMPLLARLGAVCGGISKFGSAMANAHGVCATPVGQPEHCAFVWSLGRGRRSASSSLFARLDNKNCEWDRTTRHGGSQMPWNQAPWALPLMEQCQASYAAHCRAERLLALAPLVPLVERADYLASVSAASPQHIGVWLARIACVRQQARAATVAAASAGLDAVRIASAAASNDPRPWMVAARQAVLATSSVDAVVSRARAVLVSECPERGDNLVKPDGSEWWCEQSTAWFQIDLGEPHRIASMRLHWWGHSVAATYAVLASTDGVAWTRQRSRADATDSGEALNNWHRVCSSL